MASPTMMNAGARLGMLSSCFIVPVADDLEGIYEFIKTSALVFKKGGGVGADFSALRPAGSKIKSTGGVSTGPLAFIKNFDAVGDSVAEGGLRKAAEMSTLRIDHPDIFTFINFKSEAQKNGKSDELKNVNLSVVITDDFFDVLEKEEKEDIYYFATEFNKWRLATEEEIKNGTARKGKQGLWQLNWGGELFNTVSARKLFHELAEAAWNVGCPGVIYIDEVNKYHPVPNIGEVKNPNPCGEFFGTYYSVCQLASINLNNHIVKIEGDDAWNYKMDWSKLENSVRILTRALDASLEINKLPNKYFDTITKAARPIGLGVFGLGNILIRLRLKYNSEEAFKFAAELQERITYWSMSESVKLAKENYNKTEEQYYYNASKWELDDKKMPKPGKLIKRSEIAEKASSNLRGGFPAIEGSRYDFTGLDLNGKKDEDSINTRIHYARILESVNPFMANMVKSGTLPLGTWLELAKEIQQFGIRNAHTTVQMPTGTTSFICDSIESSGIEPLTSLKPYKRKVVVSDGKGHSDYREQTFFPQVVEDYAVNVKKIPLEQVREGKINIDLPDYFVSSLDIGYSDHVKMQAALQTAVHNGISKCVVPSTLVISERGIECIGGCTDEDINFVEPDTFIDANISTVYGIDSPLETKRYYVSPKKKTIKIQTLNGISLEGSCNQPIRCVGGYGSILWKNLEHVRQGDLLLIPYNMGMFPENEATVDIDGLIKNFYTRQNTIRIIAKANKETQKNFIERLIAEATPNGEFIYREKRSHYVNIKSLTEINANYLSLMLLNHGYWNSIQHLINDSCIVRFNKNEGEDETILGLQEPLKYLLSKLNIDDAFIRAYMPDYESKADLLNKANEKGLQLGEFSELFYQIGLQHNDLDANKLAMIFLTNRFMLSPVSKIYKSSKETLLVDLEIDHPDHAFVANGLIIHNTVNMPESATVEDVQNAYKEAWKTKCKSITVYRDHSKPVQIIEVQTRKQNDRIIPPPPIKVQLAECEKSVIHRVKDVFLNKALGTDTTLYVVVTLLEDKYPIEVFLNFDNETTMAYTDALKLRSLIARYTSMLLRQGTPLQDIIKHLDSTSSNVGDFSWHLSKIFKKYLANLYEDTSSDAIPMEVRQIIRPKCKCGNELTISEGCYSCSACGYSKCG